MYESIQTLSALIGAGLIGYSGYGITTGIRQVISSIRREQEESYEVTPWQIAAGYNNVGGYRHPVIFDFKKTPHMLVTGLSQQGKTSMVEGALRNKQVLLLNTFREDFRSIKAVERVNDPVEIQKVLEYLLTIQENEIPLYVVIDELLNLILSGDKKILPLITRLLAVAAHKNIYIIAISQYADKESVKNKNLFNIRVCFKLVEDSSYKTVLGYTPDNLQLEPRQFHYLAEGTGTAYTYDT